VGDEKVRVNGFDGYRAAPSKKEKHEAEHCDRQGDTLDLSEEYDGVHGVGTSTGRCCAKERLKVFGLRSKVATAGVLLAPQGIAVLDAMRDCLLRRFLVGNHRRHVKFGRQFV